MRLDVPLGAFEVTRLIGVGGMGEVWQGFHRHEAVPVAIKVITSARARDPRYHEAFQNEVRAVAGLDHPGVVHVFDYGAVDRRADRYSHGRLVAGSPYLVMELADGGSVRDLPLPSTWAEVKATLLSLLDVLAHAHARGVIHRDLKPANILVFRDPSARWLRLTDFGLAHARGTERPVRGTSGTPTYMAPEQFLGQWRDFGPWTDLYALGCLGWALATGAPPFRGGGPVGLRHAHLTADPPPLRPRLAVPARFDGWLMRLMEKEPLARFQCAADAAWALVQLPDPTDGDLPEATRLADTSHTLEASLLEWGTGPADVALPSERTDRAEATPGRCPRRMPPLLRDWREATPVRRSMRLVGAGLGLFGLRTIPLVDREIERAHIWSHLAATRDDGDARAIVLHGAAGTGKSRLVEWIAQRAQEVGSAVLARATHGEGGGDGIPRMISSILGFEGLTRPEMLHRAEEWLRHRGVTDDYEWHAVVELVWPASDADLRSGARTTRFSGAEERYALVHRVLDWMATGLDGDADGPAPRRPVIVWLDDVQWGAEAIGLAGHLVANGHLHGTPLLVLLTVQDEALAERTDERAWLERLLEDRRVSALRIGPLQRSDRAELIQELLGLDGPLASQVEDRTGGNPLFAVQLVGDWVQRGILTAGPDGFVLRPGERVDLPDDIHSLWLDRAERLLADRPPDAREALRIAALLGHEVDDAEWRGACAVAGVVLPDDLVQALVERRLATNHRGGWAFAHGMLRESLARAAEEAGRAPALHTACATTLEIRYRAAHQPGLAERLGRHLLAAGRRHEALEPLRAAAEERRATGDHGHALRLLDQSETTMIEVGILVNDPRWGADQVLRAELLLGLGRLDEAEALALRAVGFGRAHGWPDLVPTALRHAGTVAAKQGRLDVAEQRLQEGRTMARSTGNADEEARCQLLLGDISRLAGDPALALRRCERALQRFTALDDAEGQADALVAMSAACRALGDLERTESYAGQAIPLFERIGSRFGVASSANARGEVLRIRGDLHGAEEAYRTAESLLRKLGSPEHRVPQLNLGLVLLARHRYDAAEHVLVEILTAFRRAGRHGLEGALHVFLMPCVAARGQWDAFTEHLDTARRLLGETGFVDGDIAWAARMAARLAQDAFRDTEARAALQLAREQWRALGNDERLDRVTAELEALEA